MPVNLCIHDAIAELQIDNPQKLNALSSPVMNELSEKLSDIEQHASVVIIYGLQKAFAVGVDINEVSKYSFETAVQNDFINTTWEALRNTRIPVIAAVSGYALGGGFELALMSDIIIAEPNAKFGFPEVNLGLMPGLGGTQMLTNLVGAKVASELIMTGDFISAQRALSLGIVSKIVDSDNLLHEARLLAQKLASKSSIGLKMIKEAISLAQNIGVNAGITIERQMFRALFSTHAKNEKVNDFLKKD